MKISIASGTEMKFLKNWRSCNDPKEQAKYGRHPYPDHDKMLEADGHCPRCAEATEVTIRKDDRVVLYIFEQELLRVEVDGVCYILDYPKIREILKD